MLLGDDDTEELETEVAPDEDSVNQEDPVRLKDLRISFEYVRLLREATIANDFVDEATKKRLRNPLTGTLDFQQDPDMLLAIKIFLAVGQRGKYEQIRLANMARFPDLKMPSYDVVKSTIEEYTGEYNYFQALCP